MAQNQNHRVDKKILAEDKAALDAISGMTNYTPARPEFALTALNANRTSMDNSQKDETQKQAAADAARDVANAAEWSFHNAILGAKLQVKALFGDDSNEVQSLGLKKKSERKKPTRKTGGAAPH